VLVSSTPILAILGGAYWAYQEYFVGRVGDDIISAIEEVRNKFKTGTSDVNEVFENYAATKDLSAARLNLRKNVLDTVLKQWVTEDDGTAAYVDRRRRAKSLI
jgi:hypothetical protein